MANYEQLQKDYPGLAAMFQKLQDGIQESALVSNSNAAADIYTAGEWLTGIARLEGAGQEAIAAGLRLVADAIDPPPMVEAMREVAEALAQPKRPVNCMVCGETEHIEMDCPYLHGRARHVCDDTCPAKYPQSVPLRQSAHARTERLPV